MFYLIFVILKKGEKMKKSKLLLSLAMMCLSVAVLCFGVLAAQSVNYTISGTISYTVEDVFANISARVFKVSGQQTTDTMQTNVDTLSTTALGSIANSTYIEDTTNSLNGLNTTDVGSASDTITIDMKVEYLTYYIVINISNLADRVINAKLTDATTYTNLNTASKLIQNGIAKGETKNLIVAFSLADKKVGIESLTIDYSIAVRYKEFSFVDELTADTTNSYWYVELGQKSSTDTTKLRWRYVGDYSTNSDGTETFTRYDYTEDRPTVGSGSVFVQQTPLSETVAWGSSSSAVNYFTESTLRERIKDGDLFNLTTAEEKYLVEGIIKAKNLGDLTECFVKEKWFGGSDYGQGFGLSNTKLTVDKNCLDSFWLMDVSEACLFFNDPLLDDSSSEYHHSHTNVTWTEENSTLSFWLRNPCVAYLQSIDMTKDEIVDYEDKNLVTWFNKEYFYYGSTTTSEHVRAAFQLT